jgi:hypothetical protein
MTETPLPTVYYRLKARRIRGARKHYGQWKILRAAAERDALIVSGALIADELTQGCTNGGDERTQNCTNGGACSVDSGSCSKCGQSWLAFDAPPSAGVALAR